MNAFFQDNSQLYSVNLNEEVYEQMLYHCDRSNPYETGGVLIGNYSPGYKTANVLRITKPPKNSRHSKGSFRRGTDGMMNVLDSVWPQGQYYLGEWHYHPNVFATPSYIDIKQMFVLSKDNGLKCPEPILIIVGGRYDDWSVHVSVFTNKSYTVLNQKHQ